MGPGSDDPITVNGMLNCGSHVILIDSMLVEHPGLCWYHLHNHLPISVAVNSTSLSDSHLHKYIKISPYAPDFSWTSQTVKAFVTPGLCVPLHLGLPFLTVNCILADFETHTVIDKNNNYALLNCPPPKPH